MLNYAFRTVRAVLVSFALLVGGTVVPTGAWFYVQGWPENWRNADWSSSGIAPDAAREDEAIIQVYAARAGRWKSIFAVHTWIALKPRSADRFARYEVVGWGNPLRRDAYPIDGRWYGNAPYVIFELRGAGAEALIERIETAIAAYPHAAPGQYSVWPGPNSNSFIAWIARAVPELRLELPPTAIGKDYLGAGPVVARTPSGTGWQVSWSGLFGLAAGMREGIEVQFLGATVGIDPQDLAIKLPAIGMVGLGDLMRAVAAMSRP
jgi:hypothetical protein